MPSQRTRLALFEGVPFAAAQLLLLASNRFHQATHLFELIHQQVHLLSTSPTKGVGNRTCRGTVPRLLTTTQ